MQLVYYTVIVPAVVIRAFPNNRLSDTVTFSQTATIAITANAKEPSDASLNPDPL